MGEERSFDKSVDLKSAFATFYQKMGIGKSTTAHWAVKAAYIYLSLPFILFCLGFLKLWIGLPVVLLLCWVLARIIGVKGEGKEKPVFGKKDLLIGLALLGVWVFLSGIGGYAFQNTDFHWRNAIFNDLINYSWPVYYPKQLSSGSGPGFTLIYYIGFWLPAALIGKLFGTQAANLALFLWAWLGVVLVAVLLKERTHASLTLVVMFLVLFGGMDILGCLLFAPQFNPTWPPITHLQRWAPTLQFSSFTTQLYWVYNQAIPAWICFMLLLTDRERGHLLFTWSLCVFFAPLPAIGMIPFLLLLIPRQLFNPEVLSMRKQRRSLRDILKDGLADLRATISMEAMGGGGVILITTLLYFSANKNTTQIKLATLSPSFLILDGLFLVIEGLLLWFLFIKRLRHNLWWYLTGVMLVISTLIIVGVSDDFCMRASIPTLMLLMTWCIEAFQQADSKKWRMAFTVLLVIGAITPLYEINRSVYRTVIYMLQANSRTTVQAVSKITLFPNSRPELDHLNSLTADYYASLDNLDPMNNSQYLGLYEHSFFFKYLARPPQP